MHMSEKKKSPVFEYVNAVTLTKDTTGLTDPSFEKNYIPFIVNRALSYFQDSVLAANLMNERAWLDKRLQFLGRKSTRLNSSHVSESRMPSSA